MTVWHKIDWEDIPSREEFEQGTIGLLLNGETNTDRMRDSIRRTRKLILNRPSGRWNSSPSDKFVNEHAWVIESLITRGIIERIKPKEYRLKRDPR